MDNYFIQSQSMESDPIDYKLTRIDFLTPKILASKAMRILILLFCCFLVIACGKAVKEQRSFELAVTQAERIIKISKIFKNLPSPILDARLWQETINCKEEDGVDNLVVGPHDYIFYYRITVAPSAVQKWTNLMTKLDLENYEGKRLQNTNKPPKLWDDPIYYRNLAFYKPNARWGLDTDWIAVSPSTGYLYFFNEESMG